MGLLDVTMNYMSIFYSGSNIDDLNQLLSNDFI